MVALLSKMNSLQASPVQRVRTRSAGSFCRSKKENSSRDDYPLKVAILGASGYTGAEVMRLLGGLKEYYNVTALTAERQAGKVSGKVILLTVTIELIWCLFNCRKPEELNDYKCSQ